MKRIIITEEEKNQIIKLHSDFKKSLKYKVPAATSFVFEQEDLDANDKPENNTPKEDEQSIRNNNRLIKILQLLSKTFKDAQIVEYPANSKKEALQVGPVVMDVDGTEKKVYKIYTLIDTGTPNVFKKVIIDDSDNKEISSEDKSQNEWTSATFTNFLIKNRQGFRLKDEWINQNYDEEVLNDQTKFVADNTFPGLVLYKKAGNNTYEVGTKGQATSNEEKRIKDFISKFSVDQQDWYASLIKLPGLVLNPTERQIRNKEVEEVILYQNNESPEFKNGFKVYFTTNRVPREKIAEITKNLKPREKRRTEKALYEDDQKKCQQDIKDYLQSYINANGKSINMSTMVNGQNQKTFKTEVQRCSSNYYKRWNRLNRREGKELDEILDFFMKRTYGSFNYDGNTIRPIPQVQDKNKTNSYDWALEASSIVKEK